MQINEEQSNKKIGIDIIIIIVLLICLSLTSFALSSEIQKTSGYLFQTGHVEINLNNQIPIIEEDEYKFEPGITVVKNFFVDNLSTCEVYYRVYFDDIVGDLKDKLSVTIWEAEKVPETSTDYKEYCTETDEYVYCYSDDENGKNCFKAKKSDTVYFNYSPIELCRDIPLSDERRLDVDEMKCFIISFHYPEEEGNEGQGKTLEFSFCADAIQIKNNPLN